MGGSKARLRLGRLTRERIRARRAVVLEIPHLLVSTSGRTQGVELSGELGLRLDEGATVVAHGLVAGVGVLGDDSVGGRDENEDQEDKGKDHVDDEECHAHDTSDETLQKSATRQTTKSCIAYRLVKDLGEEEQQDDIDKVDRGNGNVEDVCLLVHPRSQVGSASKQRQLDDEQSDSGDNLGRLRQGDEHALDEDVDKDRNDEPVGGGTVLDVEEAPFVQSSRVRVEDVSRVLVHDHRLLRKPDDLEGGETKRRSHGEDHENSEDDLSGRVAVRQLPETENAHLRISNEGLHILAMKV